MSMFQGIKQFVQEEDGASAVEYALLLTFVAVVIAAVGGTLGDNIKNVFSYVTSSIKT